MKGSIGKRVIGMLALLGVLLLVIIGLNMSSLTVIGNYNKKIAEEIRACEEAVANGDMEALAAMEQNLEESMAHISIRISGTHTFDAILVVLVLIVNGIILFVAMKSIVAPAKYADRQLKGILDEIVADQGDLTRRIEVRSKNEIGHLANGINGFIEALQKLMRKLQQEASNMESAVNAATQEIDSSNANVRNVSSVMEEFSASMEQISATMEQLAQASEENLTGVQEISQSADEGSGMVSAIKERASRLHQESVESRKAALDMMQEIGSELRSAVGDSQSVKNIDELTGNILSIARQTNLLALNASIEAARAGDAGRGFAVVADEIRLLADNSRDTANNIQTISELVTRAVERLSENATNMLRFMGEDVVKNYDTFEEVVSQYEKDADTMNTIFLDLSARLSDMSDTMHRMNSGIGDVSNAVEEGTSGIADVAADTNALASSIERLKEGIEDNQRISGYLKTEVEKFKKV